MEITDLAILVLKSFLNLFRISVISLRCGSVFRYSSDVLSYYRWCGVLWKSYSSPLYSLFVVPCGTFLNCDEDVDILVEFASCLFNWNWLGFHYHSLIFVLNTIVLIHVWNLFREYKVLICFSFKRQTIF